MRVDGAPRGSTDDDRPRHSDPLTLAQANCIDAGRQPSALAEPHLVRARAQGADLAREHEAPAGLFLLALPYHLGASNATAQAPGNPIVTDYGSRLSTANGLST